MQEKRDKDMNEMKKALEKEGIRKEKALTAAINIVSEVSLEWRRARMAKTVKWWREEMKASVRAEKHRMKRNRKKCGKRARALLGAMETAATQSLLGAAMDELKLGLGKRADAEVLEALRRDAEVKVAEAQ